MYKLNKINPLRAYRDTNIKTASGGKLILMIYDEAIKQLNIAMDLMTKNSRKLDDVNTAIIKAQDLITELTVSLDFEQGGEIARNLFSLYMFFNKQLMEANVQKDIKPLVTTRDLLISLKEAWVEVFAKAGMDNRMTSGGGVNIAG